MNVIAHSKGGLDARAASFFNPGLIDTIGMLSTPNAGSVGADNLCALRHIPFWVSPVGNLAGDNLVLPRFGPCDSEIDGLYDMQSSYMQTEFNPVVRDNSSKRYFDLAGNCMGNGAVCPVLDVIALRCRFTGGDEAVCVQSAFWLTARTPAHCLRLQVHGGEHTALGPIFLMNHYEMRDEPCPTLRLLSEMYPKTSKNNPYTDGGGPACPDAAKIRSAAHPWPMSRPSHTPSPQGHRSRWRRHRPRPRRR